MTDLNPHFLVTEMLNATNGLLKDFQADAYVYAQGAFRQLAETLFKIDMDCRLSRATEGHARLSLRIARSTAIAVLLAVSGLPQKMAEQAVDTALHSVRIPVNESLGWPLL